MEDCCPTRGCGVGVTMRFINLATKQNKPNPKKFRIAIDFSAFDYIGFGGQYRYVINLILGLSEIKQDDFTFIVFGTKINPEPEIAEIFVRQSQQWIYKQIPSWGFKGRDYANYLRYAVLEFRYKIDLWHMPHTFIPGLSRVKLIVTEHDLMYELFDEYLSAVKTRPYQIHKWLVQKRVDQIIAISYSTANDLVRLWDIPEGKISVVQHGIRFLLENERRLRPDLQSLFSPDTLTLLSPFNLEPRKNLKSLLLAFKQVREQYPNLQLILYGKAAWTTERNQDYLALVHKLGLEDNIVLTGFVEETDLIILYKQATLFVFPSLYEGFGFPVLEAMSVGTCVLACKSSSLVEVVDTGGLLVDTSNIDELTKGIITLLADNSLRKKISAKAAQVAEKFSVEAMTARTFDVYKKVSLQK
jgi:glycosyltransferase involved in cell wall biosynthesis